MKTAIIQSDIVWASPKENHEKLEILMNSAGSAELFVLPEMFSTGFCVEPKDVAETDDSSLEWMKKQAFIRKSAIAGSVAVMKEEKFYNRFYFVFPNGDFVYYDKRHLFAYGGENKNYTHGDERVVVEYNGYKILLEVCYDLRFPVWARNKKDYDMILYVASWPTSRVHVWNILLRARAIENQCYVVGVNRVGRDPYCEYCGDSVVIDAYGKTIAECGRDVETGALADVNIETLNKFRKKFPVLDDADSFDIRL